MIIQNTFLLIFLILPIPFLFKDSQNKKTIYLSATYITQDHNLLSKFTMFYGHRTNFIKPFKFTFDLNDDKMFINSIDISDDGIKCENQFSCQFQDQTQIEFYRKKQKVVKLHKALSVFQFNKQEMPHEQALFIPFELNNFKTNTIEISTVGLRPSSEFWTILEKEYNTENPQISFEVSTNHKNAAQLISNPNQINTKVHIFPQIKYRKYYKQKDKESINISKAVAKLGKFKESVNLQVNLDSPYIFMLSEKLYSQFLENLKEIICLVPSTCKEEKDLFGEFSQMDQFELFFDDDKEINQEMLLRVHFNIKDLFYIDNARQIQFNFAKFNSNFEEERIAKLGLLFLNKYFLSLIFNTESHTIDIYFYQPFKTLSYSVMQFLIIIHFLLAIFITVYLIQNFIPKEPYLETSGNLSESFRKNRTNKQQ